MSEYEPRRRQIAAHELRPFTGSEAIDLSSRIGHALGEASAGKKYGDATVVPEITAGLQNLKFTWETPEWDLTLHRNRRYTMISRVAKQRIIEESGARERRKYWLLKVEGSAASVTTSIENDAQFGDISGPDTVTASYADYERAIEILSELDDLAQSPPTKRLGWLGGLVARIRSQETK